MPDIVIRISCHEDDLDWLRNKCVPAVENEVVEQEDRLDRPNEVEVSWEVED
jgi:hypothetical protein